MNPVLNNNEYERLFRIIHRCMAKQHVLNPQTSCIIFSVIGAALLNKFYSLQAKPISGAAAFDFGLSNPIFYADRNVETFSASNTGFHAWIEADGWLIDLTTPLLPEIAKQAGMKCSHRRMLQRPLSDEASSPFSLTRNNPFFLLPDYRMSNESIDTVFEDPRYSNIVDMCFDAHRTGDKDKLSAIRVKGYW